MRRAAVVLLLLGGCGRDPGPSPAPSPPASPLDRGVAWLLSRQHEDGLWRGVEVSVLRPGPAMTAFVVYALGRRPEPLPERVRAACLRALAALKTRANPEGWLGVNPAEIDYPNYATSLEVLSLIRFRPPGWEDDVKRKVALLRQAQLDEDEGWAPADPEYGGWAMGGYPTKKPDTHRLDISHTRFVLEALHAAGVSPTDPTMSKARRFIEGCQNFGFDGADGGFFFSPTPAVENKAGAEGLGTPTPRRYSYGSVTCDGLLGLGWTGGDPGRIQAARSWLERNFKDELCPGFRTHEPPWAHELRHYWLLGAAQAMPARRKVIAARLTILQETDGSWKNREAFRFDLEPLLVTAFSVGTLGVCEGP